MKWEKALEKNESRHKKIVHPNTYKFFKETMRNVLNDEIHKISASFYFGREDLIPIIFDRMLSLLKENHCNVHFENLELYLARHIEVDGEDHGPMAL